jgi:RluA family pseudouridine synthase
VKDFEFDFEESPFIEREPKPKKLEIIKENQEWVGVFKPAGLLSIPDRFGVDIPNAEATLRNSYGEIFLVHRLDKDTSGVMVFAKTSEAHRKLSIAFEERRIAKTYVALVDGTLKENSGEIIEPIGEDPSKAGKMKIDAKNGKDSKTSFKVRERFRRFTLLELNPETGRQHQIRVHCAHIGHPLAVDPLYGKRKELKLSEFKRGYKGENERPILGRLSLHAELLSFPDPLTGEIVAIQADLPKDMRATLKQLRQHDCV